ncbi:MAG TPA: HAD family hydrolase [Thermoanaerobaculia bacterium]|nr:HAD family hydrolase [Thermoanaerobaculia bacterium]
MIFAHPKAVVFDWDGTILDSAEPTYRTYVRLFAHFGIPFGRADFARTYSPNWYRTFRALGVEETLWPEADALWMAYFAEESIALFPGAREALDLLHDHGVTRAIVTSGGRERVSREVDALGVGHHFEQIVFGCDTQHRKPHPEGLHICLDRLGIKPEEAVYIGDSPEDVLMAKAANVRSIAVPGGYPNREA